jgi:hypothetical protein
MANMLTMLPGALTSLLEPATAYKNLGIPGVFGVLRQNGYGFPRLSETLLETSAASAVMLAIT